MIICTYLPVCLYALDYRYVYMHSFSSMFICTYLPVFLYALIYRYVYMHLLTGMFICTYLPVCLYKLIYQYVYMQLLTGNKSHKNKLFITKIKNLSKRSNKHFSKGIFTLA